MIGIGASGTSSAEPRLLRRTIQITSPDAATAAKSQAIGKPPFEEVTLLEARADAPYLCERAALETLCEPRPAGLTGSCVDRGNAAALSRAGPERTSQAIRTSSSASEMLLVRSLAGPSELRRTARTNEDPTGTSGGGAPRT
jgi:hypothetical protein